jgi:hypothetical protein
MADRLESDRLDNLLHMARGLKETDQDLLLAIARRLFIAQGISGQEAMRIAEQINFSSEALEEMRTAIENDTEEVDLNGWDLSL